MLPTPHFAENAAAHAAANDDALARAWSVLESVPDPEIPVVSIRELGILRGIEQAEDGTLEVVITPTYSGCPAMAHIAEDIAAALERANLGPHRIKTVLAPAWTTDWITDEARDKLRAYGIAPPGGRCASTSTSAGAGQQAIRFVPRAPAPPACPHCGSAHTERLSQFGSTACKALYRCIDCREPFDYFKPY
ncbi:1,2-phenylacetyl-CoA epoxidase subunit PaaD [Trinickia acidisoli]|uniref:1,2-phenylacetyl-CoA epoxidase subunit PaaD n=1 Tax=Trinickia acidisoli TaxID=2767482 RepID=UPI001A8C1970|nr:1,2-phenylacetyl-CoA epoxidase subunit PaaD [Trinickia acidisoli]